MADQSYTQTDLSLLARLGDSRFRTQAWSDFLERYTRVFFAWFRHWGVDPSIMEDVLQETMIRVLGDIRMFEHRNIGSFRAWLQTLAKNSWNQLMIDAERTGALRKANPLLTLNSQKLSSKLAENHLLQLFDLMATRELLDLALSRVRSRVDAETWETYRLVTLNQNPVPTVLQLQNIDPTRLYNRLYRVRQMIKEEMDILDSPTA